MRSLLALIGCLLMGSVAAQNFAPTDTITEYPHYGTYYHDRFVGRKTASGEVFDQNKFTAAHWKIKLGTWVLVTNQNTGLQVVVKVNDRCPKHGVFDMSHRAATAIGIRGCQRVRIRIVSDAYVERWKAQESLFDSVAAPSPHAAPTPAPKKVSPPDTVSATPPAAAAPNQKRCCNIALGTASTHAEAYEKIHQLPEYYHTSVLVDAAPDDTLLTLTLNVSLPLDKAQALSKALLHSFPDNKVVCCE